MHRAASLAACLAAACSGGQEGEVNQTVAPGKKGAPKTQSPAGVKTDPTPPAAPPRRGFDPPRLYVNDRGVYFEILDLDDLPYEGKIVTYHDGGQKITATEKVFEKGRLSIEREYWPSAKPKLEITYNLGSTTTNRYDQQGNEIKPSPKTRSLNWTYNYNAGNTRLEGFIRQNTAVLVKFLGEPDSKLNNVWIYRNMRITNARTGRQYTVVKFSISNNTVSSVVLLR